MLSIKSSFHMRFGRWFSSVLVLCIALALAGCGGGGGDSAQGDLSNQEKMAKAVVRASNVTVTNMTLVSSTRVGRTAFNYVYQITVQNNGYTPLTGVTATLTGVGAGTTIINGAVQVGDLAAGATVTTQGTITLQQDRTIPLNQAALVWSFTNTVTSVPVVVQTQAINVADGATINVQAPGNPLNGTIVTIPPNALGTSGTDSISIGYSDTLPGAINPTAVSAGAKVVSKVVQLTHTSTAEFTDSLTVTIPYDTATVGPNEVPVVLYWDETLNNYQAVKVISFDRAAGTITFRSHHFTNFIVVYQKGLYVALSTSTLPYSLSSLDTHFQPNQDGFAIRNFGSATGVATDGACYSVSVFALWNFAAHNPPLFTNYFGATSTNPLVLVSNILEQDLARELIYAAYDRTQNQNKKVASDIVNTPVSQIDATTALTLITNLLNTNTPQMLDLFQYRNYANLGDGHSVVVYAWDAAQGFLIYDPNSPGVPQSINFQWPNFSPYSPSIYNGKVSFTLFGTDAPGSFYSSNDLSNLYSNASSGSENWFSHMSILSTAPAQPSGLPAKTYAIDATSGTFLNAQTIIPPLIPSTKSCYFNFLCISSAPSVMSLSAYVYVNDGFIGKQSVAADGTFSVYLPRPLSGITSEELLIIVQDSTADPTTNFFTNYAGFLRATLTVSAATTTGTGQITPMISAGYDHTCALTAAGGVKCWGGNYTGELGDGTTTNRLTPGDVSGLASGVTAISAGSNRTCALTTTGGVKCWGDNYYGELGDNTTTNRLTPVDVSGLTNGVAAISAARFRTCALTTTGGVKCWGNNGPGALGDNSTIDRWTPVDVLGLTSGVTAISTGDSHTCALTTTGGVKCWGWNGNGELGDGTTTQRLTPVDVLGLTSGVAAISAGYGHTCALTTSGGVKCWGLNYSFGVLGDGTITNRLTPVDVSGLTSGVTAISTGALHTCALTMSGGVKCWGSNYLGQLGDNSTTDRWTPVDVSGLTRGVTAVSAGFNGDACALTTAGGVKCWGWNSSGQLGDNSTTTRLTPVQVLGVNAVGYLNLGAGSSGITFGGF